MKNKIFVGLAIVIIIGVIVVAALGFNVDVCYRESNLVEVQIGQEFNVNDIKAITGEVFGNSKVEIEKAGMFNNYALIRVKEINEEQKNQLNTKINEKYGIENKVEDINVEFIPRVRILDLVKPYVIPFATVTILVLIYFAIRFGKIGNADSLMRGAIKVVLHTACMTTIAELLYFSIIAITRYPFNRLVMPVAMVVYIAIVTVLTGIFEKQKFSLEEQGK